jgi:hypothetical protein
MKTTRRSTVNLTATAAPGEPGPRRSLLARAMVTATPPATARYAEVFFGSTSAADDRPIPYVLTEAAEQLPRTSTPAMSPADQAAHEAASYVRQAVTA